MYRQYNMYYANSLEEQAPYKTDWTPQKVPEDFYRSP